MDWHERIMLIGAISVSVIVTAAFGTVCILILFHEVPAGSQRIADTLFGFLGASFGGVVAFWTGPLLARIKQGTTP